MATTKKAAPAVKKAGRPAKKTPAPKPTTAPEAVELDGQLHALTSEGAAELKRLMKIAYGKEVMTEKYICHERHLAYCKEINILPEGFDIDAFLEP